MRGQNTTAVEMIHALGHRIGALHLHDNNKWKDSHALPFTMDIDFVPIMHALGEIGYAGDITMLIGVNNEGKVTGLVVREAHETFGLGGNALTDHVFLAQFLNKTGSFEVETHGADAFSGATAEAEVTEGETVSVDAITGATVTSKAVVRCVNSAVAFVTGADTVTEATSWGG